MPASKANKLRLCPCGCGHALALFMQGTRFKGYSKFAPDCPTAHERRHAKNPKRGHHGMQHPRAVPLGTRYLQRNRDGLYYWRIKVAPTGKWPYEHRLIVEQRLGRPLVKGEHVHHKNHNTLDNTDDNLVILSHAEHIREHLSLPDGQWSLLYTDCQACHSTARKHCSKGLCTACYQQQYRSQNPAQFQMYERQRAPRKPKHSSST
jgi:hypothetical protein